MEQAQVGLIGLAVMGANLARNLADKKICTLVYNRTEEKTRQFMERFGVKGNLDAAYSLEELVRGLARPRRIILMIKAGPAVDAMLEQLLPLLDKGDILIDGGNSFFEDTRRRSSLLAERGLEYVGMGVSGGEEGALHGPSLMPGGSEKAYLLIEPMLQSISAKAGKEGKEACVTHIGPDGAGHYVKMVHNGIEYADMQLIADACTVMRRVVGLSPDEMADVWETWNRGELSSYLVEITARILRVPDEATGKPLIDVILDAAGQKGTGKWTSLSALELGIPAPTITEAVFARCLSGCKEEREALAEVYVSLDSKMAEEAGTRPFTVEEKARLLENLQNTLYAAKICAYAQGFNLLRAASDRYGWDLRMDRIARIWRSGCIIRAAFLDDVSANFAADPRLKNLLFSPFFAAAIEKARPGWGRVVALAVRRGIPVAALSSALAYFDGYRMACGNANILQAQRDYFGAHTYQRVDKEGVFHTDWLAQ